ncbi:MAG TPA: methyltransferase [Acidimicrobiales bacterium]|nr:methyltransferase [Acidimicrobiales bacterium]
MSLFRFDDADDYRRVWDTLAAAGYDDKGVSETLGGTMASLADKKLPVLLRRTSGGTPLETLIRLFILGVRVPLEPAGAALAPMGPEWWAERGLVTVAGGEVEGTVQLRCYQGLVVAFDFHRRGGAALPPDHVMGISPSSLTLAGLTVRRPSRATLDLGTGSGFQAFLAAAHSDRVVATDRNPRAVEMATFNAGLNGLSNVDCREGDLFQPVQGDRFELVVSNPPFIVSPDNIFYFLHSGMSGDELCRTIAREGPGFLAEGGYCQFLANWTTVAGEDWRQRLAAWFDGTGCDALVLRQGSSAPDEYAAVWIENEEGDGRFDHSFAAWMDYYGRLGIDAIHSGLVTMRRSHRSASPWFRAEDTPDSMTFPAGEEIARRFEAEDFLLTHAGDEALLATAFRLAADVRLDQHLQQGTEGWELLTTRLHRVEGLHWSGNVDLAGASLLVLCDGTRPMADLLADLAQTLGPDADELSASWPATVRRLVQFGFLEPA